MRYLPLFHDVRNRCCVLIGGGEVAVRKFTLLRSAGALVRVVSPEIHTEIRAAVDGQNVIHLAEKFRPEHLDDCVLVICATDDEEVNRLAAQAARTRHIPVNVVDQLELCSVIVPAIIDRDPITIAVSSSGSSPVLARWLRTKIEALVPAYIGKLATFMAERRIAIQDQFATMQQRRRFWETLLESNIPFALSQGRESDAATQFEGMLNQTVATPEAGRVFLIGAGPGDPDLMTVRAVQRLQQADVVVYDRLVAPAIIDLSRRDADRMYVGKDHSAHSVPQEEISQRLVDLARSGKIVARLKGGDPFIFGRGGEEIQALAAAGVPFEVVPGITAALGCSAYAGIPLTHRDYSQSVRFITGHTKDGKAKLDWANLAASQDTLVFYMGLDNLAEICTQLVVHGLPTTHGAALIEQGTTEHQKVIVGTVTTLPDKISTARSPSLLIVGNVVHLHNSLAWFKKPGTAY
ncbi:MAG: siroheme synthase CysG [Betaproteobacteria bacterium]|nr:siroheme synthase CysG [Betaproteobacteria bacterium]